MGVFFSAGWSPCIGPVLGAIYTVLWINGSILRGTVMLVAYSAGLGRAFSARSAGDRLAHAPSTALQEYLPLCGGSNGSVVGHFGDIIILWSIPRIGGFGKFCQCRSIGDDMEHDAPEKKSSAPLIVTVFYRKGDENSAKVLDELHSLE